MKHLTVAAIALVALAFIAVGQEKRDVDELEEKITSHFETWLPSWKHTRVELGSKAVLSQKWWVPNRIVSLAVAVRESSEEAKKEVKSFLQFNKEPQFLPGFGGEAFAPDVNGDNIVLIKGRLVIYLSIIVYDENDAGKLSQRELTRRSHSEAQRILREFATQISSLELPAP